MSFDLAFCRKDHSIPSIQELKDYFTANRLFQVNDENSDSVQFWYQNDATGVYCSFSYSLEDTNELEGCGSNGLAFNLNYIRPSFFAYESMPLVEAFCKSFDLMVEDSQRETVEDADAKRLITSWCSENSWAVSAMINRAQELDIQVRYHPEPSATDWWHYMSVREEIEASLTEDIFVPSLMILMNPDNQLFTMMVWPTGIAQFFPPCDYLYVQRTKKGTFRTTEETGLISYQLVLDTLSPLLEEYRVGDLQFMYLSSNNVPKVGRLIQAIHLKPVDLSQYTEMSSESFHDVAVVLKH